MANVEGSVLSDLQDSLLCFQYMLAVQQGLGVILDLQKSH